MPKVNDIGYSEITPIKIQKLGSIFGMHQRITQAVLEKHPGYPQVYRYIDLTAGKGISPDGTNGSPLVVLENAIRLRSPFSADFIERREQNIEELKGIIANDYSGIPDVNYHLGDYREVIPRILPTANEYELGLAFVDPSGNLPDFDTVRYIAEMRPRMEILIYLSSTVVKRVKQYTHKFLADYLGNIPKKNWLISTPLKGDKFNWVFLLGSNSELFRDYKKIDFYRLDSDLGENLFSRVNLTKQQQSEILQPRLPFPD